MEENKYVKSNLDGLTSLNIYKLREIKIVIFF